MRQEKYYECLYEFNRPKCLMRQEKYYKCLYELKMQVTKEYFHSMRAF